MNVVEESVLLGRIANCTSRESLQNYRDNGLRAGNPTIVAASIAQMDALRKSRRAPRNLTPKAVSIPAYRGAFPDQLAVYLAGLPGQQMNLRLPLADEKGGKLRPDVAAVLGLNAKGRIWLKNLDRLSHHSSLSDLRANYLEEGGGSDSWSSFIEVASGRTIAEAIGVDPADAHESRRVRRR